MTGATAGRRLNEGVGPRQLPTPAELEQLTELVYRMLRADLRLLRERHGVGAAPWR
jgi:hypothetical protein